MSLLTHSSEIGKLGEDLACRYLKKKGYKIIDRNYRQTWGELDIVAVSPSKILVFIEVKTVSGPNENISAEDQLTCAKRKKLEKIALFYANSVGDSLISDRGWQIDLLAITKDGDKATIKHYENI